MDRNSSGSGDSREGSVESLFAELVARAKTGARPDLDAFCSLHPEHGSELRRRFEDWRRAGAVLERLGLEEGGADQPTPAEPDAPTEQPGLSWSRYTVTGEIGRGGMGSILSVRDEDIGRELAMKVLRDKQRTPASSKKPTIRSDRAARFMEEARITGRLQHPNIVPVHELGVDPEGRPYFTMKLVEGRTLREIFALVRKGEPGWTVHRVLGILLKACEAVSFAHDKGIVHRDLKPSNLMVGSFGEVYVMDWGLALDRSRPSEPPGDVGLLEADLDPASPSSGSHTREGDILGTPEYMAPEQAQGDRERVGPLSDVFAVGAMLYELLTGRTPHGEKRSSSPQARLAAALRAEAPPVASLAPGTPAELCAICERATARDPQKRYTSMVALALDLRAYLEGRVVAAYATGAGAEFKKWVQRNPVVGSLAGLLFVVLTIGLVAISRQALRIQAANSALETKTTEARASENLARQNAAAEKKRADEVFRLSLSQDHEDLMAEAAQLWPPYPDRIAEYEAWLGSARELVAQLPDLEAKRDELRCDALPRSEEERLAERASHPELGALQRLAGRIEAERRALAVRRGGAAPEVASVDWSEYPEDAAGLDAVAWPLVEPDREVHGQEALGLALAERALELTPTAERAGIWDTIAWARFALGLDEQALEAGHRALELASTEYAAEFEEALAILEEAVISASSEQTEARIRQLEEERESMETRVDERRSWSFPEEKSNSRWWNNQLTKLIGELEALTAPGTGLLTEEGVSAEWGWSVPRRLAFAKRLRDGLAPGGEFQVRWERDLPEIRKTYPGLRLYPQLGLVPIGPDPDTGLWEFWHVLSGTEPLRGASGALEMTEASGLVFVLLRGGSFWMGAQKDDPDGQNYDPWAERDEGPVHQVELSAFFLSKYEMTQGQWERLAGVNPSYYQGSLIPTLLHPVEQVSWSDCMSLLPDFGLTLPSEAQWEYGARAGTNTPWWTGEARESLREMGAANLADRAAARAEAPWSEIKDWPELDDGHAVHAPVGSLAANAFGLHEVHGNVCEWCLDGYDPDIYEESQGRDPVSPREGSGPRVDRGGGFSDNAVNARVANRDYYTRRGPDIALGLRPARMYRAR